MVATALVGLAVAALVWFFNRPGGLSFRTVTLTAAATGPAPKVGSPAPDFTVKLLDGQTVELADYQGEVVWINFWATWCPPCRAEMPDIQEVFETYRDQGLRVIALSIGEQRSDVQGYVDRTGLGFDIGLDSDTAIAARYRVVGIPTHYFVDRDGTLREIRIGALNKKGMEERVRKLLEGVAP
ncbi:MAG: hypothetical protein A2Z17_04700 [Gammaproteobacteria bacterium RBG_16_66_13]|nr:MAG: hypothetical protein A2Z17_04700 [Gammaproteobacteria bacterium RBG_16_66_13]